MTTTTPNPLDDARPTAVTMDRIIDAMKSEFDITLIPGEHPESATANLNGLACTFAVLGSMAIVRAEADSGVAVDAADATWYLAANDINSTGVGAAAIIVDRGPSLLLRTEAEMSVAAGLTDAQLTENLRFGVDAVITTHDAVRATAEHITARRTGQA
ncbi:hypothetical protein [Corynebacterium guangdongense]|uniref:Uncharacterized protein n=1 Tax=Corynebacterium guangdongense TaxID=1783348 RepID=A0ABU1ZWW1_9CORY|nr:hypothetical protein [Corynebacterium guangdongense]MDR7329424.1 hypothetical protein [Corynebacterium guangdongense]WJZ17989.1 hypothetical protein CGUA_07100 [Corynebacterium guangdongense]